MRACGGALIDHQPANQIFQACVKKPTLVKANLAKDLRECQGRDASAPLDTSL